MRKIARVDSNHAEVVEFLRKQGAIVRSLANLGGGVPDLLVSYNKILFLIEVKDGKKAPSQRKLTKDEADFFEQFDSHCFIVCNLDEALDLLKGMNNERPA
jgi:Holliday junction resolvase